MPLPGRGVFDPRWSDHHRPTAGATMTAFATIRRAGSGEGTYDAASVSTTPPADVIVERQVRCRVQAMPANNRVVNNGAQVLTLRAYLVQLPADVAELHIADVIKITNCADVGLVGRELRILDITYGSEQWTRDVLAEDNLG